MRGETGGGGVGIGVVHMQTFSSMNTFDGNGGVTVYGIRSEVYSSLARGSEWALKN